MSNGLSSIVDARRYGIRARCWREGGFSMIEALVAAVIFSVGVVALAQLFAIAIRNNASARSTSSATVLAQQKMEQLRGLAYGFDWRGVPLTDTSTDTRVVPEAPTGGTGLSPSPAGALASNTNGYCDFLDRTGNVLVSSGTTPPDGTVYTRRWSIEPIPDNPNNSIVLQVLVTAHRHRGVADTAGVMAGWLPGEARIVSVKTRKGL